MKWIRNKLDPEFTAELVLRAYTAGIFPMGHDDGVIRWYSPDRAALFRLKIFMRPNGDAHNSSGQVRFESERQF